MAYCDSHHVLVVASITARFDKRMKEKLTLKVELTPDSRESTQWKYSTYSK